MTEEEKFLIVEKIKLITSINARVDGIYNLGIGIHIMDFSIYKTDFDNDNPIIDAIILDAEMREKARTLMIIDRLEQKKFNCGRSLKTIIKEFLDNRKTGVYDKFLLSSVQPTNTEYYRNINFDKLENLIKEGHLEPKNSINP
jgi:hypothetical protein